MNLSSLPFTDPRYAPMIPTSQIAQRQSSQTHSYTHQSHKVFVEFYRHQTFQPDLSDFEPRLYHPPHAWHPLAAGQPHVLEAIAWLRCLPGVQQKKIEENVQSSFSWMRSRFQGMEWLHLEWQGYWKHVWQKPTTVYMWSVIWVCDMDHDIIRHCLQMCQKMSTLVQTSCCRRSISVPGT